MPSRGLKIRLAPSPSPPISTTPADLNDETLSPPISTTPADLNDESPPSPPISTTPADLNDEIPLSPPISTTPADLNDEIPLSPPISSPTDLNDETLSPPISSPADRNDETLSPPRKAPGKPPRPAKAPGKRPPPRKAPSKRPPPRKTPGKPPRPRPPPRKAPAKTPGKPPRPRPPPRKAPAKTPGKPPSPRPSPAVTKISSSLLPQGGDIHAQEQLTPSVLPSTDHAPVSHMAALIIGIEYTNYARRGIDKRLPGCHKDVETMKRLLIKKYGVKESNITVLKDGGGHRTSKNRLPTKNNIIKELKRLLQKPQPHKQGPSGRPWNLWLTYSGHGGQVKDQSGDEPDGKDETIIPCDYRSSGIIADDVIRNIISKFLPPRSSFVSIFDCCHSGSMVDLPMSFTSRNPDAPVKACKDLRLSKKKGQILSLGACADRQTSLSVYNLDHKSHQWSGALTYAFSRLLSSSEIEFHGDEVLKRIGQIMQQRGYPQITTLSTNRLGCTRAKDIMFPFEKNYH